VARSTGASFAAPQQWAERFCSHGVCAVGDFDGDGKADIVSFVRDTQSGDGRSNVWTAFSTGSDFGPQQKLQ